MAEKRKIDNISKDDQGASNFGMNEVAAKPSTVAPSGAAKFTKSREQNLLRAVKPIVFSPSKVNAGTDAAQQRATATSRTCEMCWEVSYASDG